MILCGLGRPRNAHKISNEEKAAKTTISSSDDNELCTEAA